MEAQPVNNHNLRPLAHLPDNTPLLHTNYQHYDNLRMIRLVLFTPGGEFYSNLKLGNRDVVAILMNPTLFRICTSRIRDPTPLSRFLSSIINFNPQRSRFDNLIYGNNADPAVRDFRRRHTVQPKDQFRPGPVFLIDSQSRHTTDGTLCRVKYEMRVHGVDYRLIEYTAVAAAPAQQNPLVGDQGLDGGGLQDENMLGVNPVP